MQKDYFIDYIYQYICIFTLQYGSSENLTGLDKGLNAIALVYSYIFIAVVISLIINSFDIKKDIADCIPKDLVCGSTDIKKN